ncbi:hypothetical protein GCM10023159_28640 [Brevibacterium yomogidense]
MPAATSPAAMKASIIARTRPRTVRRPGSTAATTPEAGRPPGSGRDPGAGRSVCSAVERCLFRTVDGRRERLVPPLSSVMRISIADRPSNDNFATRRNTDDRVPCDGRLDAGRNRRPNAHGITCVHDAALRVGREDSGRGKAPHLHGCG